jgi:hypothetical protein
LSKLKIEHGVSRVKRAKLQTYIDQTVSEDIELMGEWSDNETHYIINELLRFALTQDDDFQKYKAEQHAKPKIAASPKAASIQAKPSPDSATNPATASTVPATRPQ